MRNTRAFCFISLLIFSFHLLFAEIPSPEQFLGFKPGANQKLADLFQIIDYFNRLDEESERIVTTELGKTTAGNPFIVAYISSPANLQQLEKYQTCQQLLADPRKITSQEAEQLIAEGKTVVMINCSIHASEIGASQMSLLLAFDLATANDQATLEILDKVILILLPMHNPDGIQMVADWYKKNLGTAYEGCRLPWLYHQYVGHDINRDWYMFTQVESQLTLKLHNAWHPQVVVDMHQMGSRGARLFVPPYIDPFEPNVDPIIQQQVAALGTFIASELTAAGKSGVRHSSGFDAWTPARAYQHYHGGVRILTECAGVKIASPIHLKLNDLMAEVRQPSVSMPLPWHGGNWTLADIVAYDLAAAKAVLIHASQLRESWLRNFYRLHQKAVQQNETPFAFIIPKKQRDFATALKMLQILQLGMVEIQEAQENFVAENHQYDKGSFIIFRAQPYGGYAKALLEKQVYPEIRTYPNGPLQTPYDVVAHTLPLLMGVKVVPIDDYLNVSTIKLENIVRPKGSVDRAKNVYGYMWGHDSNDDIIALNRLLKSKHKIYWAADSLKVAGKVYPPGEQIVEYKKGIESAMGTIAENLLVNFESVAAKPAGNFWQIKPIRLGLYKSYTASIDEGWTRWVLEQYEFSWQSLFNDAIKKGNLNQRIDVLILPDMAERAIVQGLCEDDIPPEYAGGIDELGIFNIKKFVEKGGTLITLNAAAEFAIKHFSLAIEDSSNKLEPKDFFIPGSILSAQVDNRHPIGFGLAHEVNLFFLRSPIFKIENATRIVTYPGFNPLLSGWANGEKYLFNKSALVEVQFGKGKIILIGFPALYRGQAHGTFRFLFNAIYYGAAKCHKF